MRVPRKCGRGPVPVRIEFSDAVTGAELLTEQAMLTPDLRAFTATLAPLGGGVSGDTGPNDELCAVAGVEASGLVAQL